MTAYYNSYDAITKKIIDQIGKTLVIAIPLGIGKPIGLVNAFYRMAVADPSIKLTIITGLTLARPQFQNELEKRFLQPILERMLKDYEDPLYEHARELQQLPDNISVIEFFLTPGKYLKNNYVQQNYISSKYTSVVHDALHYDINVFAQQVARSNDGKYSLSSNTDTFQGLIKHLNECQMKGKKIAIIADVNLNLPFMLGDAVIDADVFTDIIDTGNYKTLFPIPRQEISIQDHLIGIYTSCLIKDNGCLQIGIGELSNAVANALIFRHKNNVVYQDLLNQLAVPKKFGKTISTVGSLDCFTQGLYASTEMLSDEFIQLYKENILKKRVYDHIELQRLLNLHKINENINMEFIDILLKYKIIDEKLSLNNIDFLKKFGILLPEITYDQGNFILPSGEIIPADLTQANDRQQIIEKCFGKKLQSGKIIHAGFFLGSAKFYQQLRDLSLEELQQIDMTDIARTNGLLWSYELALLQRQHARFINSVMMITLGGALVSDGLKNLQEVSGVGGQFDFVNMVQNLPDARSIIKCRSTKLIGKRLKSNIVWDYPNFTIPRYLRDIFVTEYGIADCRSETDAEIIKALLNVCDSRFQEKLLKKAKSYGKLPDDYEIPAAFQNNEPAAIEPILREFQLKGFFKPYPFGSDLTEEEKIIEKALLFLKDQSSVKIAWLVVKALFSYKLKDQFNKYLIRLKLDTPKNTQEFFYNKLLKTVFATLSKI